MAARSKVVRRFTTSMLIESIISADPIELFSVNINKLISKLTINAVYSKAFNGNTCAFAPLLLAVILPQVLPEGTDANVQHRAYQWTRLLLLHRHINVNLRIKKPGTPFNGWHALYGAVVYKHRELMQVLLANERLSVDQPCGPGNAEGRTALMIASQQGSVDIVRDLLMAGADATVHQKSGDNESFTAMHYACYGGHFEVARVLASAKPSLINDIFVNLSGFQSNQAASRVELAHFLNSASEKAVYKREELETLYEATKQPIEKLTALIHFLIFDTDSYTDPRAVFSQQGGSGISVAEIVLGVFSYDDIVRYNSDVAVTFIDPNVSTSLLFAAISNVNDDALRWCLENGVDLSKDTELRNQHIDAMNLDASLRKGPVLHAAQLGGVERMRTLLVHGGATDNDIMYAAMCVAMRAYDDDKTARHLKMLHLLLDFYPEIAYMYDPKIIEGSSLANFITHNGVPDGLRLLHAIYVRDGHPDFLHKPFRYKGNVLTPLHVAIWLGRDDMALTLLELGVPFDIDATFSGRKISVAALAVMKGSDVVVQALAGAGVDFATARLAVNDDLLTMRELAWLYRHSAEFVAKIPGEESYRKAFTITTSQADFSALAELNATLGYDDEDDPHGGLRYLPHEDYISFRLLPSAVILGQVGFVNSLLELNHPVDQDIIQGDVVNTLRFTANPYTAILSVLIEAERLGISIRPEAYANPEYLFQGIPLVTFAALLPEPHIFIALVEAGANCITRGGDGSGFEQISALAVIILRGQWSLIGLVYQLHPEYFSGDMMYAGLLKRVPISKDVYHYRLDKKFKSFVKKNNKLSRNFLKKPKKIALFAGTQSTIIKVGSAEHTKRLLAQFPHVHHCIFDIINHLTLFTLIDPDVLHKRVLVDVLVSLPKLKNKAKPRDAAQHYYLLIQFYINVLFDSDEEVRSYAETILLGLCKYTVFTTISCWKPLVHLVGQLLNLGSDRGKDDFDSVRDAIVARGEVEFAQETILSCLTDIVALSEEFDDTFGMLQPKLIMQVKTLMLMLGYTTRQLVDLDDSTYSSEQHAFFNDCYECGLAASTAIDVYKLAVTASKQLDILTHEVVVEPSAVPV